MTIERAILELIAETSVCESFNCQQKSTYPFFLCEEHTKIFIENLKKFASIKDEIVSESYTNKT